jgi:multidrug transporter EmrE-like cation transporter
LELNGRVTRVLLRSDVDSGNRGVKQMRAGSLLPLGLVGLSVILSVCGQLVLKLGVTGVGTLNLVTAASLAQFFRQALSSPLVLLGFAMYGLSAVSWLIVLSRLDLSYAYPFLALNYVLIALVGRFVLGEDISLARWVGLLLVCIGIVVVARS